MLSFSYKFKCSNHVLNLATYIAYITDSAAVVHRVVVDATAHHR